MGVFIGSKDIFAISKESVQPLTTDARDVDPHLTCLTATKNYPSFLYFCICWCANNIHFSQHTEKAGVSKPILAV